GRRTSSTSSTPAENISGAYRSAVTAMTHALRTLTVVDPHERLPQRSGQPPPETIAATNPQSSAPRHATAAKPRSRSVGVESRRKPGNLKPARHQPTTSLPKTW